MEVIAMSEEIVRADRSYRRKFFTWHAIFILLGAAGIVSGLPWLEEYLRQANPKTAAGILKGWFIFAFLSIIPIALYMLSLGRKVITHERIPLPGAKVIIDTRPIVGQKARLRGRGLVVVSLLLIALGLSGALFTPYMLDKITSEEAKIKRPAHPLQETALPHNP
jgi:voltage-gated potassium channel Kch